MDVSQLPFNRLIGLELVTADTGDLVRLPENPQYANHLGTVHASALLAVAEAGSGAFLGRRFGDGEGFIPVVRTVEAKFRKPAQGAVTARCSASDEEVARWREELGSRGRCSLRIPMEVLDGTGSVVLRATVEWFVAKGT